jgi:hypothetical protein
VGATESALVYEFAERLRMSPSLLRGHLWQESCVEALAGSGATEFNRHAVATDRPIVQGLSGIAESSSSYGCSCCGGRTGDILEFGEQ